MTASLPWIFLISAKAHSHNTHIAIYPTHQLLPLEIITRGFPQEIDSGHDDRVRYEWQARERGEELGWAEVSQREEGRGEELVASHDLQTPSEESAVFEKS